MKIVVMGSGSAYGSPMIFNTWDKLKPQLSPNIRNRASLYLEINDKKFVIDTGPEFRLEVNQYQVTDIDAILLTHGHYDHIGGLPELTRACDLVSHPIEVWLNAETREEVQKCFGFMINKSENETHGLHWRDLPDWGEVTICGEKFQTFEVPHHKLHCSAFRYQNFAYVTDWEKIPEKGFQILQGVKVLIIECNNGLYHEYNGHSDLKNVKKVAGRIKPERIILTHLSTRVDYEETSKVLPPNFELAYDGMELTL